MRDLLVLKFIKTFTSTTTWMPQVKKHPLKLQYIITGTMLIY